MKKSKPRFLASALAALLTTPAYATDGYFSHGYGVKSQSMGGVGIALPQDTLAAASNPAGLGLVGDRVDIGATWFRPNREAQISNTIFGISDGTFDGNDTENFLIPEFGYNRQITPDFTLGVSVFGNGGMNTDYKNGIPAFGSTGDAGIDYLQLFVAPTATWKVAPNHILGVSLNLAYQRLEVKGLQGFIGAGVSSDSSHLTNRGHDNSYGAGVRIGWVGKVSDSVTLGATYQSKTYMSRFDKYRGLLAEHGDMDAPANYGVGVAFKATPQLTVAADVQRILYGDVASIGNKASRLAAGGLLGQGNGAGFGWSNATIFKLGASYAFDNTLTLRAGYNHVTQPIPKSEAFFNILAPGIVQDHVTLGATWALPNKSELSLGYTHAFEESVQGNGVIAPAPAGAGNPPNGGNVKLRMHQNSIGIAYGWAL